MAEDLSSFGRPAEDLSSFGKPAEDLSSLGKSVEEEKPAGVFSQFGKAVVEHPLQAIPGVAEAVAGGTVGMGTAAVSGLAGLGTAVTGQGFTKGYEATKEALSPVDKFMAPETEVGKAASGVLGALPEAIHGAGEKVFEKTGSPLAGAATEAIGTGLTFLIGGKLGKEKILDKIETAPEEVAAEATSAGIPPEIVSKVVESTKEQPTTLVKQADNIVRQNINNRLASNRVIKNNTEVINKAIPDPIHREAISDAIDKGEVDQLPQQQKDVANHVTDLFNEIGTRAKDLGIIDGLRENYIAHIVDWSKVAPSEMARLRDVLIGNAARKEVVSQKSRFGKERKYGTFDALQEAIKDTGLEIKTKDVGEIYKAYASSMERAIENKNMIESLKKVQAEDEQGIQWAIQKVSDKVPAPRGWIHIDNAQMRGYAVNPDLAPMMKFVFEGKEPNIITQSALALTQATKRLNVVGSLFHAKSLTEAMYGNLGAINTLKEVGKMSYDKLAGTSHAAINKALDNFKQGGLGDSTDKWLREGGLTVEVPEDISIGVIGQLGKVADDLISKVGPKTTIGEKTMGAVEKATLGVFDKLTWDYLHTGLKLSVAEKMLETAKRNHPDIPEATHRLEISRHLNNSFGGLNWFDVATQSGSAFKRELAMSAFSPQGRRGLQLLMFAPDWTVSTLRAFTTAFGKGTGLKGLVKPATQADYARRYQMRTALIYATAINAMQYAMTGHSILDNNDPTRLEFDDGTSMQLMKHAAEPYHWIADPDKTFANKLGFLPRTAMIGFGGLEYASPIAPKLTDTSASSRVSQVLKTIAPFQLQSAFQAPEGEELNRAIMGTLGFPTYGMTDEERKQKRAAEYARKKRLAEEYKKRNE